MNVKDAVVNGAQADVSWDDLERIIDRFEETWLQGQRPRIDDYLPTDEAQRRAVLVELVHADLERRLEQGEPARVETYLEQYPELAGDRAVVFGLIAAEHEIRRGSRDEYVRRFPVLAADLPADIAGQVTPQPATTVGNRPSGPSAEVEQRAVPGFEIVAELGRGGMGVVYQARQVRLDRWVALKMILAGAHAGPEEQARFRNEAEAVARLQHPNIIQVFEVGEHRGLPFLALEYVAGGSLAQKLDGTPWPAPPAAELTEVLARAVHHAHQQGVVHRDLKPANILMSVVSGPLSVAKKELLPAALRTTDNGQRTPVPKITDFGLAKRLDHSADLTRSGALLGTPSYMAPEQVAASARKIGPAVDVYALGAILYELLTGRPPFRAATGLETLEQLRTQEPVPPRRLQPNLPRDLEIICLRCLEKEPRRRYTSALDLADELRRFQAGEPIRARATPAWERLAKWAWRRPAVALLTASVVLVAAAGFAAVTWQLGQTRAGLARSETNLYSHRIALADREWLANHVDRAEQLLAECPAELRGWEWHYLRRLCRAEQRSLPTGGSLSVAFSPGAEPRLLAVASADEEAVQLWDLQTGQRVLNLSGVGPAVALSPDGKSLATATWKLGPAGELLAEQPCAVQLRETATGQVTQTLPGHVGSVLSIAFSPDGKRLATGSLDRTVKVWNTATGQELLTFKRHTGWVESVAFSPDGKLIASAGSDGALRVWNAVTGTEQINLGGEPAPGGRMVSGKGAGVDAAKGSSLNASRGGATNDEKPVKVWDSTSGQAILALRGQTHYLYNLAFAPDGKRIAAGRGNTIRLWELASGKEVLTLRGHNDLVRGVAFSRDGNRLASASFDQSVKVWDLAAGDEAFTLRGHSGPVNAVKFSDDDRLLASASWDGTVKIWDAASGGEATLLRGHGDYVRGVAWAHDSSAVATASADRVIKIWDPAKATELRALEGHVDAVNGVVFSPDGTRLASAGYDRTVTLWDTASGRFLASFSGHSGRVYNVAFSPDGQRLASASQDGTVRLWETATGKEQHVFRGHTGRVFGVVFAPDGKRIASAGDDRIVRVWNAGSGAEVLALQGHDGDITNLTFSRDGRRIASSSLDRTVRVWDTATGKPLLTLKGHTNGVTSVAFAPCGRRLATSSLDRTVKIWDAGSGQELLVLRGPALDMLGVAFSPDGRRLAATSVDGIVYVWDGTPREGS